MKLYVFILLSAVVLEARSFVNLTFDDPDLSGPLTAVEPGYPRTPLVGNTAQILRGWTLFGGGTPLPEVGYSTGDFLEPVTLFGRIPSGGTSPSNFELLFDSRPPNQIDLLLRQVGRIPDNASGLSFFANGPMEMIVNGELLHRVDVNETVFPIVDVSRFAGQTVTLDFHVYREPFRAGTFFFDIKGFTQVPEPSVWALFGVGAAGLVWAASRRRKS